MARAVDIVVIGAGAAGLAAARAAEARGLRVVVLEAKSRTGGRGYTDVSCFGVPFDRGCYWLHSADINPFRRIADALGFHYRSSNRKAQPRRIFLGDRWATGAELRAWQTFERRNTAAVDARGHAGRDQAVAEVIENNTRWSPLYEAWTTATSGIAPESASTKDFANYRDTHENWPVREGFGALIAAYGAGLPIELATPVEAIEWGGPEVRVTTHRGTLSARAAIVTVSTAVLAGESIRFTPRLPDRKHAAIAGVPMGMANKIAIQFDRDVFGLSNDAAAHTLANGAAPIHFQLRPFGWNLAVGHVGGRFASDLERGGERAMIDFALGRLKAMFGTAIERHAGTAAATRWAADPFIGGGYSAALPGQAHRRADLAAPLRNRLFFAGEATSIEFYSTAHGAYLSGVAAARQAAAALGRRS